MSDGNIALLINTSIMKDLHRNPVGSSVLGSRKQGISSQGTSVTSQAVRQAVPRLYPVHYMHTAFKLHDYLLGMM